MQPVMIRPFINVAGMLNKIADHWCSITSINGEPLYVEEFGDYIIVSSNDSEKYNINWGKSILLCNFRKNLVEFRVEKVHLCL